MKHTTQTEKGKEFILFRFKEPIPGKNEPKSVSYDNDKQIWIDNQSNQPLVETLNDQKCSKYGETLITETGEGVDQSEVLSNSDFGETIYTATNEGVDQREMIDQNFSTDFGETLITKTSEGVDQREIS